MLLHVAIEGKKDNSGLNLFYDISGKNSPFLHSVGEEKNYSLKEWQSLRFDLHSSFANPGFWNLDKRDFRLKKRPDRNRRFTHKNQYFDGTFRKMLRRRRQKYFDAQENTLSTNKSQYF